MLCSQGEEQENEWKGLRQLSTVSTLKNPALAESSIEMAGRAT